MALRIPSELSEYQIESDIASYLGYITPFWSKRHRLISVNEQLTGADKLFFGASERNKRFVPIYLQFKVSQGIDPQGGFIRRFSNSDLARIVRSRSAKNLDGDPILYFRLRRPSRTAIDLQHNVLHSLHNPPLQYSLYVAPLTLHNEEYVRLLEVSWYHRFFSHPFEFADVNVFDNIQRTSISLGSNPFLRGHISIPPHAKADNDHHYYSYSRNGSDVMWHGGDLVPGDFRLSTQLAKIFNNMYSEGRYGFSWYEYVEWFEEKIQYRFYRRGPGLRNASPDSIRDLATYLRNMHQIHLMILHQIE